jgi:hypothetical protein
MSINIFLSYPTPHQDTQKSFIDRVEGYVRDQGLNPCTMGISNYDMDAPLAGIRRLMVGCCGLLAVAFKRSFAKTLDVRSHANIPGATATAFQDTWLTSPYCQIEPAMAYQLGLPILILREKGVLAEGVLEQGVTGLYCPEFDCSSSDGTFDLFGSKTIMDQWVGRVRATYENRGAVPKYY